VTSLLFQPHADTVPESGKTAGQAGGTDACGNPNVAGGQWLFKELSETGKLSNDQQKGLNGYRRIYDNCTHTVSALSQVLILTTRHNIHMLKRVKTDLSVENSLSFSTRLPRTLSATMTHSL
jgi:hypothetical protein